MAKKSRTTKLSQTLKELETMSRRQIKLKALGVSAKRNKRLYQFDHPDFNVLERFKSPTKQIPGTNYKVTIVVPEFSSLCPITGQPDFATIFIEYQPKDHCVESKSLKLYLNGYRNHGSFHEEIVNTIADHLDALLEPVSLYVRGEFAPRGGISFWPHAYRSNPL